MGMHTINLDDDTIIEFELIRKKVININLTIRSDLSIFVSAKPDIPIEAIYELIRKRSRWIKKRLGKFIKTQKENKVEREYVSGESYKYLGKQYRMIVEYTSSKERIILDNDYMKLFVRKTKKRTTKARIIDEWYREKAREIFDGSLNEMFKLVFNRPTIKPNLDIKIMTKRWGSCLKVKNKIILNLELIKAPLFCIDYVLLHELIHFIYRNHDSNFYELLTVLMPDWKQRKRILDQEIVLYV